MFFLAAFSTLHSEVSSAMPHKQVGLCQWLGILLYYYSTLSVCLPIYLLVNSGPISQPSDGHVGFSGSPKGTQTNRPSHQQNLTLWGHCRTYPRVKSRGNCQKVHFRSIFTLFSRLQLASKASQAQTEWHKLTGQGTDKIWLNCGGLQKLTFSVE